ncbi:MAG TPA: GNVR domain-containing protein [Nitrospiraceae bacterium]|nr:GNVR domain-containing protein [Nitrospiraceae bacterium]
MTPRHDNRVTTVRGDDLVDPDMWTVIANRRTLIGSIVFGSVVIALVASLVLPKTYESTVSLLPQLESKESGTLTALLAASGAGGVAQNLGIGLPGLQTTPTDIFVAILKSRVMSDEVIKKFDLMSVYGERTMQDTREELADRVRVAVSKEKVIKVTVEATDAELAAEIANFYVGHLDRLNHTVTVSKASQNRAFIERRLVETKVGLVKGEEALRDFQTKNKTVAVEAQSKAMIEAAAMIQGQITAQEVQLEVLSSYLSQDNPELSRVRSSIEQLTKQLMLLESGKGGKGMLPGDRLHPAMITVPDLALQYGRLLRELKVQETLYALLTSQFEQAKITEARDTPTVQILDPAIPADKPSKPRLLLNILVAAVAAFCLALVGSYILESRKRVADRST